jgi:superfamily II DNA helicase RecQ
MVQGYAEVRDGRRGYLLNYFGEEFDVPCGYCDNCEASAVVEEDESNEPFPINSRVVHKEWGKAGSNAKRTIILSSSSTRSGTRPSGSTS